MVGPATLGVMFGISLVFLSIPGSHSLSAQPPQLSNGGYSEEIESLFGDSSWLNYSFHGVIFEFHLWCSITVDVGYVCGHATESSGTSYSYQSADGLPPPTPPWQPWISPDAHEEVWYKDGGLVQLFVAD
jgi:hypothetical protein